MDLLLFGVLGASVLAGLRVRSVYNRLVALDERCNTAFADIDVQLKHRHSVIPALVETVRGYAGHELEILQMVTAARSQALGAVEQNMRLDAEMQLGKVVGSLMSLVESYPDIAASGHFRGLRDDLTHVENRITAARRFYNLAVDEFNATLRQFPGNLISGYAHLGRRRHFDLGAERILLDEPVAVKF